MSEIIPAIIPEDIIDLEEKLGIVVGQVPMVHIDVLNGSLTPNSAWPYLGDIGTFLRIVEEAEGFPFWEDISFEAHLMVKNPEEIVEDWIKAGAERIIVHLEAFDSDEELSRFLSLIKNRFSAATSYLGIEAGLAVNLDTPLERLLPHIMEADFIQFMSIEGLGKQGGRFNKEVLKKIKEFKSEFPDVIVSIDGGINLEEIDELKEIKVERFVVGSAIYGAEDPEEALYDFLELNRS